MKQLTLSAVEAFYDVVIVGAGAAGCAAAHSLETDGRVLLVDSRPFPRQRVCGGLLVSEARSFFDDESIPAQVLCQPEVVDCLYYDWARNTETRVPKGVLNVDRQAFDEWLWRRLESRPIDFCQNTQFFGVVPEARGQLRLGLGAGGSLRTLHCKYLLGCDGPLSKVRRRLNVPDLRVYLGMQEQLQGVRTDCVAFVHDPEVTDFYSWIIPKDNSVILGSALPRGSSRGFQLFKKKAESLLGIRGSGDVSAAMIARPFSLSDVFLGRGAVLLAGEAAGLISPSSAEGISFALHSGRAAARALNCVDPSNLRAAYQAEVEPLLTRLRAKFAKLERSEDRVASKGIVAARSQLDLVS